MTRNNGNRALADVVSVEAWHAKFDKEGRAKVHVDLSFLTGEIGADDECAITFRVALKRAVLRLVVPPTEPIAVIQSSVDREATLEGFRKVLKESTTALQTGAGLSAHLSQNTMGVDAKGQVRADRRSSTTTTSEMSQAISAFKIRQYSDADGNYCWEIVPEASGIMDGKVWEPVKQPRLSIKQTGSTKLPPVLQAHVLCRRNDIVIDDIKFKKGEPFQNKFMANRKAAARAVIKERVLGLGLDHPEADNDLIEITIAECIVVEEIA